MTSFSPINAPDTVGFGCPSVIDPHFIMVVIPRGRTGFVLIAEHYGVKAGNGVPEIAERCQLPRHIWSLIAEDVKREFNERLRSKMMSTSRWLVGENKVERLLGKELLVLAWAVERAEPDSVPNAIRNWIGLRPEERWWLFNITAAATGGPEHVDIGWRKALRHALTENPISEALPKKQKCTPSKRIIANRQVLFPGMKEEENSLFFESSVGLNSTGDK